MEEEKVRLVRGVYPNCSHSLIERLLSQYEGDVSMVCNHLAEVPDQEEEVQLIRGVYPDYSHSFIELLLAQYGGDVDMVFNHLAEPPDQGPPRLMIDEEVDIIFCGNPGVGKSTLLTSVSGIQFKSGFHWGEGLTNKLDFKWSDDLPNVRFCDTPGLSDVKLAQAAAEAITTALREGAENGRRTLIFFVVVSEAGRVHVEDLATINQVMGSITLPNGEKPSQNHYAVIFNKCTFLQRPDFQTVGQKRFEAIFGVKSQSLTYLTSRLFYVPHIADMVNQENCSRSFEGLREWIAEFYGIRIVSADPIEVYNWKKKLEEIKEVHQKELAVLEERLRSQNAVEVQALKNELDALKRDFQEKTNQQANTISSQQNTLREVERKKRGGKCTVM